MKNLPLTEDIETVSRHVIWFEDPAQAIADPIRFLAYAMTYGDLSDMEVLSRYVTKQEFQEALQKAPPGIFDARSWAYWHLKFDLYPPPPLPERELTG